MTKSSSQKDFNAFVGCETGLLKGVSINPKCNISKNFHNLKCLNKEEEITALAFADRAHESEILLGLRNGSIRVFDTNELSIAQSLQGPTLPISPVVGVARTSDDTLVSAWQNGVVRVWKYQDELEILPIDVEIRSSAKWKSRNFASEEDEMKHLCSLKIDRHLCQMVAHPNQRHLMATGGKENDLQVWDLNRPEAPVFRARNVPLDSLQLRVPVWVSGVCFPDPLSSQLVSYVNRHGHVRLYDLRISHQRRPVANLFFPEEALTAISASTDPNQVIVGTSKGQMALFDFRKEFKGTQGMFRKFKGCVGAIRSIDCATNGYFASVGLDRFLRVYHVDRKKVVHTMYLKSRLNRVVLRKDFDPCQMNEEQEKEEAQMNELENKGDDDIQIIEDIKEEPGEEEELMWAKLAVVGGSKKRKTAKPEVVEPTKKPMVKKKRKKT
ncbi:WD repeat-containing protein 74-like [Tigriopus californicus]|uniref:WD repeat-containing protein 74-like n=1 Tax=Tigriopus californicus TaxID=6832 RepID=UPI0027D9E3EB|nr:WD repeat-containing protein 74-like [Tigriopus californicus]